MRGEGPRTRLKRVERLLKDLGDGKPVPRKRLEQELVAYRLLLQALWIWQFRR